ncbi:xanthine dehydrogenase family protein molybdopterin-binding subunit [bacterium]|nr:xanthine dehydrogenase family protein molybdopterin-binding subunit [bacterium]MCB2179416.1 xanthine dehydrogenase family protein molybdopterin-binding subunit [bacterium]
MRSIGQSATRVDSLGKVLGKTEYPGDLNMENQAYAKILFAFRPHAIVKAIDTSKAEALEGVLGVFTAKDVPVNEYGLTIKDQPVLCGPGASKPYTDRVRFVGDQVAVVVAETEALAAKAANLIDVTYEDLPVLADMEEAHKEGAFKLHPNKEDNTCYDYHIRKGDVEAAFAEADVIIEGEYYTPVQEHAFLAPESGIVYFDEEDRITIAVAGQWAHEERAMIAHALDLDPEKIRVIHPAIGGAFGGREDISIQLALALSLWRLGQQGVRRPIKLVWSRQESMIGHHKRHPYLIRAKWGATKDGRVIAAKSVVLADAGAYNYTSNKVLGNATLMVSGPYAIDNVWVDSYAVYTNNIPGGAFRGFGGPQGAFAAEQQISKLAEVLGMDPVEIRMKNVITDGVPGPTQTPLPSPVTMDRVIEQCALAAGWEKQDGEWVLASMPEQASKPHIKRGLGFACGFKNVGFSYGFQENSTATVELFGSSEIERAVVHHAGSDVGQGAHTIYRQVAAEVLGIPLEKIELAVADTAVTGNAGSTSASRMTFMAGNSIRGAAKLALQKWQDEDRPAVAEFTYLAPKTTAMDHDTGKSVPNFAYGYVAEVVDLEVDTETGEVTLRNVICANDVGKALNPQQVEGQIEGALVQAGGYVMSENFIQKGGYVATDKLSTYLIPTILDVPEKVEPLILEYADAEGPFGARGMGEMPFIPLAPAITAAFHQATGVWLDSFPLTAERVLRGLGKI